jgi:toxin ParE1/3/4
MSRYHLTRKALADLQDIRSYITEHGTSRAAIRWIQTLRKKCQSVADTPGMGRPRDDLDPGLRSVAVGNYLIFYREESGRVDIVHVLHGARDIERVFSEEQGE